MTPWHLTILDAAASVGLPRVEDLNDLDQDVGAGITPVNIFNSVRWNTAFAYVDPVRSRSTLSIWGNMLVDRLIVQKGRVTASVKRAVRYAVLPLTCTSTPSGDRLRTTTTPGTLYSQWLA